MTEKLQQGAAGEEAAIDWLRSHGFMIEARNLRYGRYEIDIVASRWGTTHFVEVKTRRLNSLTSPEEAIDDKKRHALHRAISAYVAQHRLRGEIQIDLAAVDALSDGTYAVRYIENAIEYGW
ncbi:MAG: YraN family protein [Alistipes sp.]|nr:YraN family protein [Alistipes sp.]